MNQHAELAAAIANQNPSAPPAVVERAATLAARHGVTVEAIEGEHGHDLVVGLTDDAHNQLADGNRAEQ